MGVAGSCLHARPKRWLNIRWLLLKRKPQPERERERAEKKPPKSETKRSFSGEKLRAANGSDKTTTTRKQGKKRRRRMRQGTTTTRKGGALSAAQRRQIKRWLQPK